MGARELATNPYCRLLVWLGSLRTIKSGCGLGARYGRLVGRLDAGINGLRGVELLASVSGRCHMRLQARRELLESNNFHVPRYSYWIQFFFSLLGLLGQGGLNYVQEMTTAIMCRKCM